jgi:hypothetical protein
MIAACPKVPPRDARRTLALDRRPGPHEAARRPSRRRGRHRLRCVVQWANQAAERLVRPGLEAVGISGLDLVHPEDLEMVLRSLVSVQDKEVGTSIEVRVSTGSGWRLVELLGAPVPWLADGAILLCLRDLTERRRYELAHGEEARVQSLVQNSAAVTMLVSARRGGGVGLGSAHPAARSRPRPGRTTAAGRDRRRPRPPRSGRRPGPGPTGSLGRQPGHRGPPAAAPRRRARRCPSS